MRGPDTPLPHPLTPVELPDGDRWSHGCPYCQLSIQGGSLGLAAHHSTVHTSAGDPRTVIHIQL